MMPTAAQMRVCYHTGHPPDYYEEIPSDGTQVAKGFQEISAGKYYITIQVKSLEKLLRHRSVFWGLHCSDHPITIPEDDLVAGTTGTAYGCLSEKQPVQSAMFYIPSPKTWYITLTASNSMRKTRVAFFLYRLPDDPVPVAASASPRVSTTQPPPSLPGASATPATPPLPISPQTANDSPL